MANRLQFRRGLYSALPTGQSGEPLWCTDTDTLYVGDGSTNHQIGGAVTLAGDVTGASGSNTVAKINGTTLGTTTATSGNLLIGSGSAWVSKAISGDLSLASTGAATVTGLQGNPVSNSSPSTTNVLAWNGSAWAPAAAATGTVTSVAMTGDGVIFSSSVTGSPVTSSGTLAPSLKTQTANYALMGPTTGSAATPTFRALVAGDIPSLPGSIIGSGTVSASYLPTATMSAFGVMKVGSGLSVSAGVVSTTNNGTVTSVSFSGDGTIFNSTVSGSPITGSGTFAPALLTQTANYALMGPASGSAAAPTFRALVSADIPDNAANTTGNASTATKATNIAGGALGSIPYQSAANTTALLAGSTSSQLAILTQTGTGSASAAPAWLIGYPGQVLASHIYSPTTQASYLATTTLAVIDSTNLKLTFTAPASGNVFVDLQALAGWQGGTVANYYWGLLDGLSAQHGNSTFVAYNNTPRSSARIYVSGLTPGISYTYFWAHYCATASAFGLYADGNIGSVATAKYGPAIMTVTAL